MLCQLLLKGIRSKICGLNKKKSDFWVLKNRFMDDSFKNLLPLLLPSGLLTYFTLATHSFDESSLHIYLDEKNVIPDEFTGQKLLSKGFFEAVAIQDFPVRGRDVFLHIKRRRWLNLDTNKVVHRNWDLIAQGTRITKDFAAFLKEISRYTSS